MIQPYHRDRAMIRFRHQFGEKGGLPIQLKKADFTPFTSIALIVCLSCELRLDTKFLVKTLLPNRSLKISLDDQPSVHKKSTGY